MIEEDGKSGTFVLLGFLFDIDNVAGDNGAGAEQALGIAPIESRLGENRCAANQSRNIQGRQEFNLERRPRVDAAFPKISRTLRTTMRASKNKGGQKNRKTRSHRRKYRLSDHQKLR
jgi:hypothetical protein